MKESYDLDRENKPPQHGGGGNCRYVQKIVTYTHDCDPQIVKRRRDNTNTHNN